MPHKSARSNEPFVRWAMVVSLTVDEWDVLGPQIPIGVSESEFIKDALFWYLHVDRPHRTPRNLAPQSLKRPEVAYSKRTNRRSVKYRMHADMSNAEWLALQAAWPARAPDSKVCKDAMFAKIGQPRTEAVRLTAKEKRKMRRFREELTDADFDRADRH